MYTFSGTPNDMMEAFFSHAQAASTGEPSSYLHLHRALVCLVGLYDRQARASSVDPDRLARFRRESANTLASFGGQISAYVQETIAIAEDSNEDEWLKLCYRRSAIQVVREQYAGTKAAARIDESDLRDLDKELERVGREYGPVDAALVPRGLPASHWWWQYPTAPS